jgi:hypothetical protein
MQIASTQRAAFDSHKNLGPARNRRRQLLQLDLASGSMKDCGE